MSVRKTTAEPRRGDRPGKARKLPALAPGLVLLAPVATACASGNLIQTGDIFEQRHMQNFPVEDPILAVVPLDPTGYDSQVAQRVAMQIEERGYEIRLRMPRAREQASVMEALCPREQTVTAIDGVVFATYDRLVLRTCRTHETAYEIDGGWAGVDELVRWMDRYLRGLPRPVER